MGLLRERFDTSLRGVADSRLTTGICRFAGFILLVDRDCLHGLETECIFS